MNCVCGPRVDSAVITPRAVPGPCDRIEMLKKEQTRTENSHLAQIWSGVWNAVGVCRCTYQVPLKLSMSKLETGDGLAQRPGEAS